MMLNDDGGKRMKARASYVFLNLSFILLHITSREALLTMPL